MLIKIIPFSSFSLFCFKLLFLKQLGSPLVPVFNSGQELEVRLVSFVAFLTSNPLPSMQTAQLSVETNEF
jgi:hypothetical protein